MQRVETINGTANGASSSEVRGLSPEATPHPKVGCLRSESAHYAGKRSVCGSVQLCDPVACHSAS